MASLNGLPALLDFSVYGGDNFTVQINFVDGTTNNPWPLTGTWKAEIRTTPTATSPVTSFTIDTSQGAAGILYMSLTGTQTTLLIGSPFVWDLQQTVSGSVKTFYTGHIRAVKDVTL